MNISALMQQPITIQSQTGSDAYGKPSYGAQRTIKVRIQTENRSTGKGAAYVPVDVLITDQPILTGDRFWRTGDDVSDDLKAKVLGKVMSAPALDGAGTLYRVDL